MRVAWSRRGLAGRQIVWIVHTLATSLQAGEENLFHLGLHLDIADHIVNSAHRNGREKTYSCVEKGAKYPVPVLLGGIRYTPGHLLSVKSDLISDSTLDEEVG
jgi:hypothetical protein